MPLSKTSQIYGVLKAQIQALTTDAEGSAPVYGTAIVLPGIKLVGMDKKVSTADSYGDEVLLDTEDTLDYIDVSFENAELPLDACVVIEGATLTSDTTIPGEETHELLETGDSTGGYFKLSAIAKRGSGDVKGVLVELYKCKGTLSYSMKSKEFAVCSFKGRAIPIKGTIDTKAHAIRKTTFSAAAAALPTE